MTVSPHRLLRIEDGVASFGFRSDLRPAERLRRLLLERGGGVCGICERPLDLLGCGPDRATVDHIVALADGGKDEWDNLQAAHARCNETKGSEKGRWWQEMLRRRYVV